MTYPLTPFISVNLLSVLIPVASPEPHVYLSSDRISLCLVTTNTGGGRRLSVNKTAEEQRAVLVLVDLFGEMDYFQVAVNNYEELDERKKEIVHLRKCLNI